MQEIFQLYSKIYNQDDLTPEMFREEMDKVKNISNMWIMEIIYSFFMLGINIKKEYTPINP